MKLGILYSGGKDSTLAMLKASQEHTITCLISIESQNKESYMFHTPNIEITTLQAKAMELPIITVTTKGEKEQELADLKKAIQLAVQKYTIEGIATGAVKSTYQASRVQKICNELGIWCFNPLWLKDQIELLNEVVNSGIHAIISGVFAEPFTQEYLGKEIDKTMIQKLAKIANTHHINLAGEGGEIETTVLNAPMFKKKIAVKKTNTQFENYSGVYAIEEAELQ